MNSSARTTPIRPHTSGFTLLEVMLVVVIIGFIAVMAINNLNVVGTSDRARRTTTATIIGQTVTAVNSYYLDVGKMPPNLNALISDPGARNWAGPYLLKVKPDAWGEPLQYSTSGSTFEIRSAAGGTDGGPISSNDL